MSENKKRKSIEHADEIIERFGGIRPMAKKMDVAATTVQGWKKRGVIPHTRRAQLLKAATTHDIALDDLITEKTDKQQHEGPDTSERTPLPHAGSHAHEARPLSAPVRPGHRLHNARVDQSQLETDYKAIAKSTWIIVGVVVIILLGLGFLFFPVNNQVRQTSENNEKIETLERDVDALRGDVEDIQDQQRFFSALIPKDLDERIASMHEQAKTAHDNVNTALQKAEDIKQDVLSQDAGTLTERLEKLEFHLDSVVDSPALTMLLGRLQTLSRSMPGRIQLEQTIIDINAALSTVETDTAGHIDTVLQSVQQNSQAAGQTFQGVPPDDLKAAALLLGISQFRGALDRDNTPFEEDLELVLNLLDPEDQALQDSLRRLAPHAASGVLTPSGLSDEFKNVAGEVLVQSLQGEEVSLQDRLTARFGTLFNIEQNGQTAEEIKIQQALRTAEAQLEAGEIEQAIQTVNALDGPHAETMKLWLEKAYIARNAQQLERTLRAKLESIGQAHATEQAQSGSEISIRRGRP